MKDQAHVVVIGGGIYGVNIAYHLYKMGWREIVLLEKGEIASGESSHAAGVVTQFATSKTMMQFRKYSIELYSELGLFNHVGSLRVASSKEQLKELERSVSRAKAIGMDVEIISPSEALKVMPQISAENLYGAIYLPRRKGPREFCQEAPGFVRGSDHQNRHRSAGGNGAVGSSAGDDAAGLRRSLLIG